MIRKIALLGALACVLTISQGASAGSIWVSLNLEFNNPGNLSSGGTWTAVAKADERGIAGLVMRFEESSLNFNPATGFLTPVGFEIEMSSVFGLRLEILQGDDLSSPTLDVGVIGTYADAPNLVPLSGNPDLGSFTGGVALATGSFDAGDIPAWFDDGSDFSTGNLFIDAAGTTAAAGNVFTTVRSVVPEPATLILFGLGLGLTLITNSRRRG